MDNSLVHSALGSATAGIISRIFTHPLDTAKARLQAPPPAGTATQLGKERIYKGPIDVLHKTFRAEGLRGLYRGFGAIIVGGTPGTVIYLCSYETFKHALLADKGSSEDTAGMSNFAVHFVSGLLAETVACLVYVPVDVIKERLQVQTVGINPSDMRRAEPSSGRTIYNGSWDALKKIARNEGLSGIYKGYGATLASFGPFSAFYFLFYEEFKELARSIDESYKYVETNTTSPTDGDISFPLLVACSASAGALASWITSPLDMAKLRLQIQRGARAQGSSTQIYYANMLDCLRTVYAEFGIRGVFRGAGARVLHFAPATTITMTCYEKCRSFYARYRSLNCQAQQ